MFGGRANNGSDAGLVYSNSNYAPSYANSNIGSHLYFINNIRELRPHHSVKNIIIKPTAAGSASRTPPSVKQMKRIGNLYQKIASLDNLRLADERARKGKKSYGIKLHDRHREEDFGKLRQSLLTHTYKTSPYETFTIHEPKERLIYRLPYYPDRIIHHAIMNVLEPILIPRLTHNTFSCIKGRGIEACAEYVSKVIRKHKAGPLYCLKIDITKFYPSISHNVLKRQLRRIFKDKELLWLLDEIIDSAPGLPIGNYISQNLANFNLAPLMHKANEEWHIDCAEYADDIVFFSDSKECLHEAFRKKIRPYIENELELKVKPNWQIFPIALNRRDRKGRALDYVGYKFFRKQKLLRKSIKQNLCRKAAGLRNAAPEERRVALAPWLGWARHSNSKNLLKKIV